MAKGSSLQRPWAFAMLLQKPKQRIFGLYIRRASYPCMFPSSFKPRLRKISFQYPSGRWPTGVYTVCALDIDIQVALLFLRFCCQIHKEAKIWLLEQSITYYRITEYYTIIYPYLSQEHNINNGPASDTERNMRHPLIQAERGSRWHRWHGACFYHWLETCKTNSRSDQDPAQRTHKSQRGPKKVIYTYQIEGVDV